MNPESNGTQTEFSRCTVGNICHWIEYNVSTTADKFHDNVWGGLFIEPQNVDQPIISAKKCGNGIVEDGEQCDPGIGNSTCCTSGETIQERASADEQNASTLTALCATPTATSVARTTVSSSPLPPFVARPLALNVTPRSSAQARAASVRRTSGRMTAKSVVMVSLVPAVAARPWTVSLTCPDISNSSVQCKMALNMTHACGQKNDQSCKVWCKSGPNQCNGGTTPLLDGSPCGYGGKCYGGHCKKGTWQQQLSAMYTENLQYAVPVTVVVGLLILAVLYTLLRCMFRCCGCGRSKKNDRKPYEKRGPAPPLVVASSNDLSGPEYSAGNPLLAAPAGGNHTRDMSGASDQNVPMQEFHTYNNYDRSLDSRYSDPRYSDPYQHEPNLYYQATPPGAQTPDPYAKGPVGDHHYQDGDWIDQRPPPGRKNAF